MQPPDFVEVRDLEAYRDGDDAALVANAQGVIRRYCGWHVAPEVTETLTLDGSGSRSLWLPTLHVLSIDAITDEGVAVNSDDYDWSSDGYVYRRAGVCWSSRPRQIAVTLTHGFTDIPPELVGVAVSIAARRGSSPAGVRREAAGQVSREYGTPDLLLHEQAVLDKFKLPPRP